MVGIQLAADWDLYSAALPDYKLFSRINTFESILSRSAAEIMGNWHTGNLSNSELKTNIFVSDGDSPTEHSSKTQDCQNKYKSIHQCYKIRPSATGCILQLKY